MSRLAIVMATAGLVVTALAAAPAAQANQNPPARSAAGKVTTRNVIVLLKDQYTNLAPKLGGGRASARTRAIASDQSAVVSAVQRLGATHVHQFDVVNAIAATVPSDKLVALSGNSAVAAVVPDLPIRRADVANANAPRPAGAAATTGIPYSSYCSTDPAAPRLEPEALQTMQVAYDNPTTPSAAKLEDGSGVKVGWIADGVDINNPDFIRANGDHVFVDYQDFSGDGLNAPSEGREAFGDASAIAAQGRQTYDVNDYAAAAHPLPNGCYIRVRGVAPGASLVGLKVFGNSNSAPTSHFISAIQYAVDTAGVDVLNESFGGDPYPDNMDDPVSLANNAAIAAGVTIVSSTGDAGTNGTFGSPGTSSQVIGVAATTNFRSAVQTSVDGFSNPALGVKGWVDDNISSLSSGGFAQNGKVPDVAAPGDSAWALCSPDTQMYAGCTNIDGTAGVPIQDFGGTSQSSPLTAGTAALVIAAYEKAHHGAHPSPALVKSIIVGTAQDLGHPAYEQGAGEVDALAAVRAARSLPAPGSTTSPATATGAQLVTSTAQPGVNQLDLSGKPGSTLSGRFTVQNASLGTQTVSLQTRSLTKVLSTRTGNVKLDPNQTFPNVVGSARAYKIIKFHVPAGADRLDSSIAWNDSNFIVFLALVDPFGNYQAYSSPQGTANFAHVDARYPAPGTWKAMVWANPSFTGNINYEFKSSRYTRYGSVRPSTLTLAPGAKATVNASFPTSQNAGDTAAAIVMKTQRGENASVPVSIRTLIPNAPHSTFTGVITGGNGRQSDALSKSYYIDVPRNKPALSISAKLDRMQYPNELLFGLLIDPHGNAQSVRTNLFVTGHGAVDVGRRFVTFVNAPEPGRWRYLLFAVTPTGGQVVNQPFTGTVRYGAGTISAATPLPHSSDKLVRGKTYKFRIIVKNSTSQQQIYFADPRLDGMKQYRLASQTTDNNLQHLSLPNPGVTPNWLVPTDTTALDFTANASVPVGLDTFWQFGDPETFSGGSGNAAAVHVAASPQVSNGFWSADVGEPGPFDGPAPSGHVAVNLLATTAAFDLAADSSTGDYWFTSLIPATSPSTTGTTSGIGALSQRSRYLSALQRQSRVTPVTAVRTAHVQACGRGLAVLDPGQSCALAFTITPSAPHGRKVHGHLSIQTLDPVGTTSEQAVLPYGYQVK